jgi:nitrite reductase/ring-hydroxylating ferredoxin subunit
MPQHLCSLSELAEGQPIAVEVEIAGSSESLILVRVADGVRAYLNTCPHAGRRLDWAPGRFLLERGQLVCAAHGASFELAQGLCMGGPCRGQSLRAVDVRIEGEDVVMAD